MSLSSRYKTLRYIAIADATSAAFAGALTYWALHVGGLSWITLGFGCGVSVVLWGAMFSVSGLYSSHSEPRHMVLIRLLWVSAIGMAVAFGGLWLLDRSTALQLVGPRYLAWAGLHLSLVLASRESVFAWRHHRLNHAMWRPEAVLIGSGARALRLLDELDQAPELLRPNVLGYIDTLKSPQSKYARQLKARVPRLGHLDDVKTILLRRELDMVLLAPDHLSQDQFVGAIQASRPFGLTVLMPPELFDYSISSYRLTRVLTAPLIELRLRVSEPFELVAKRVIDLCISAVLLVLLLPVLLLLSVLVRLDSRGPVLFHQQRVGLRGQPFLLHKFRSMRHPGELAGPQLTHPNDPRITRVGRWMRRYYIDELPQLVNVLMGEMSLVGPRPERPYFIERIREQAPEIDQILQVKPGVIGWSQLAYGYADSVAQMLERMRYDQLYVQHQSWVLDLKIALLSLKRIALGKGR